MTRSKTEKNPRLIASDLAIGKRVSEVRKLLNFSQQEFSNKIGISRDRLASYEYGRAPLKADVGIAICRQFDICEPWLATGSFNFFRPSLFPDIETFLAQMKPGITFHQFFQTVLKPISILRIRDTLIGKSIGGKISSFKVYIPSDKTKDEANRTLRFMCEHWINSVPDALFFDLIILLHKTADEFMNTHNIFETDSSANEYVFQKKSRKKK